MEMSDGMDKEQQRSGSSSGDAGMIEREIEARVRSQTEVRVCGAAAAERAGRAAPADLNPAHYLNSDTPKA